jgi:TRAP-type C4-dicarboxylate transport system permease small subunit
VTGNEPPPGERFSAVRRIGRLIGFIEIAFGALTVTVIATLVLMQAGQRYLPFEGFAWTGEIARFCLVWLTFAVIGVLVTTRGHIALEIADALPRPGLVRFVQVLSLLIVAAVGVGLTLEAANLVATQGIVKSPVLRIPMSVVYIPVLLGAISTAVRALISAIDIALHGPILRDDESTDPGSTNAEAASA